MHADRRGLAMKLSRFLMTAVLVALPVRAPLAQDTNPPPPSADLVAQRRAEQALPRTAIAFDAKSFDQYVGYYQLTPRAILTVTREGEHFITRLSGQQSVEIFPESATKFFLKVVPAQLSFNLDPSGQISSVTLHQGGLEVTAPRVEESVAKAIEALAPPAPPPRKIVLRTWPSLAGITPRFLTANRGGEDYDSLFSPDGRTVLFSRTTDGTDWKLMTVPAAGGEVKPFAQTTLPVAATRASWSPRNGLIAFTGIAADGSASVWVIDDSGRNAHPVSATGLSNQIFYPSWYPDGKHLAVMDGIELVTKRIALGGGAAQVLTDHSKVLTGMPSVSPDGKWIVFAGQANQGQPYNQLQNVIWLVKATGELHTLESNPQQGRAPTWSSDGKRVTFESDRGSPDGRYAIFMINADGTGLVQVSDYELNANHSVWSADGRHMTFSARDPKTNVDGIAVIDLP
jgi:dipeptidyl aminopeptidase/acylaminoacyl peptidase